MFKSELHWGKILMLTNVERPDSQFPLRLEAACLWSVGPASFNSSVLFQQMCFIHLHAEARYIWSNSFFHGLVNVRSCIHSDKMSTLRASVHRLNTPAEQSVSECEDQHTCSRANMHATFSSIIERMSVCDLRRLRLHSASVCKTQSHCKY